MSALDQQTLMAILQAPHDLIELECVGVKYRFDFNARVQRSGEELFFEIGRNDVDTPIVADLKRGWIYFLDPDRELSFINSSLRQMLAAFAFVNAWEIPDDIPDSERAEYFSERMLAIDENLFADEEACWSVMREEIENGVI